MVDFPWVSIELNSEKSIFANSGNYAKTHIFRIYNILLYLEPPLHFSILLLSLYLQYSTFGSVCQHP